MTTNTAFGLALSKPFIAKTQIKIEDLNIVHEMVETIKSAFSSRHSALKLEKKCKKALVVFSKMAKINFCTRKMFKIAKNAI